MSVGTPVVTSDVGDRPQMLKNGEFGVLVEAGNHEALAKGLLEVLENRKARILMKENALAFRETWYWDKLIEKFIEIYH